MKFLYEGKKRSPVERNFRNLVIGFRTHILREPSWIARGDRKRRRLYYSKYKSLYKQQEEKDFESDELYVEMESKKQGIRRTFTEMKNTLKC